MPAHCVSPLARLVRAAAFAVMALAAPLAVRAADVPNVAVASNLQFAMPEIAAAFRRETGRDVRVAFGSSGNLRRQIAEGAPFELFVAADRAFVEALAREQRTVDDGVVYAIGRLALFVPTGSPIEVDAELAGVARALADGRLRKFAIANPELAPYGEAARQVLMHAGLWNAMLPRLVLGENISQAAQFAASGAAQGGIIAYSLVRSTTLAGRGTYVRLPATAHDPLVQKMVLLRNAGGTARALYAFMQGSVARAILERHGFDSPVQAPRASVGSTTPRGKSSIRGG